MDSAEFIEGLRRMHESVILGLDKDKNHFGEQWDEYLEGLKKCQEACEDRLSEIYKGA